eukprot:scpid20036/ scgid18722/ 
MPHLGRGYTFASELCTTNTYQSYPWLNYPVTSMCSNDDGPLVAEGCSDLNLHQMVTVRRKSPGRRPFCLVFQRGRLLAIWPARLHLKRDCQCRINAPYNCRMDRVANCASLKHV